MSRYLNDFPEDTIIKVLRAYLIDGDSHRKIQKTILGLPAPARGGGFVAMDILHHYDIKGDQKGALGTDANYVSDSALLQKAIKKVQEFDKLEVLANDAINNHETHNFENISVTEVEVTTKQRIGQSALRKIVLKNYSHTCALCDIHQNDLLVCSHIVPWTIDRKNRLNPQNTLLLCSLHDRLFDKGYFSLDSDYNIILSQKSDAIISTMLNNCKFKAPIINSPEPDFLTYHREEVCEIMI